MTATLPDGWEQWTPDAKQRLLAVLSDAHAPDWWADGARPEQRPPDGGWLTWLVMAGRGWGKTRTGAEWAWRMARDHPRGALVAPTAADVRDTMVEGESGVLAVAPERLRPKHEPSKRRLTYPNGATQHLYSGEEPDRLRGPQHHYAWVDEWAAMGSAGAVMDMLLLGLRLGIQPRALITTTPRPVKALREVIDRPDTVTVSGSTYDNLANLAPTFQRQVLDRYEGTRLGRQELHGEFLEDVEGALWHAEMIEPHRVAAAPTGRDVEVVVAIDPAVTSGEQSDETGIVVAARQGTAYYVLGDVSGRFSPQGWAERAVAEYERWGAGVIVAEVNNGGDMVRDTIRQVDPLARYKAVHASRGKRVRAEPVAALYEQGRVHHVGAFNALEDQMTSWTVDAGWSPDRVDALVWGLSHLSRRGAARPVQSFRT